MRAGVFVVVGIGVGVGVSSEGLFVEWFETLFGFLLIHWSLISCKGCKATVSDLSSRAYNSRPFFAMLKDSPSYNININCSRALKVSSHIATSLTDLPFSPYCCAFRGMTYDPCFPTNFKQRTPS